MQAGVQAIYMSVGINILPLVPSWFSVQRLRRENMMSRSSVRRILSRRRQKPPLKSFHSFPPFMSYLWPRGGKLSSSPLVDAVVQYVSGWRRSIWGIGAWLAQLNLDQKHLEQKVWSPIACTWALHFWIYRVSSFSVGWDLCWYGPFPMQLNFPILI